MLISSIELKNFGIFHGEHELELSSRNKWKKPRPVVLVGGKNGSGKSTIFEAIKLCLYGAKSLDGKMSMAMYESYLKSKINWFTSNNETTFVKVRFRVFRENAVVSKSQEYQYEVVREWMLSGKKVKEDFSIYEDGVRLDIDQIFWQDFIEEIIPQGVVDLFFFDGEKIQKLAEGASENLKDSIKSLLNLAIVPSLSSDLQLIYNRYLERAANGKMSKEIVALNKMNEKIEKEIEAFQFEWTQARNKVDNTQKRINSMEKKLKKEGGEYYTQQDELKKRRAENNLKIDQMKQQIGKMCEDHVPFMLFPDLVKRVVEQLQNDIKHQERDLLGDILVKKRDSLNKAVKKIAKEIQLSSKDSRSFCDKISGYTASWIEEFSEGKAKYDLPPHVIYQSLEILEKTESVKKDLFGFFDEVEKLNRYDKKVEAKIERSLESNLVLELHEKIKEQSQILGSQQKNVEFLEEEITRKQGEVDKNKKRIESLDKLLEKSIKNDDCYNRIGSVRKVLSAFEKRLTKIKIGQLEDEIYNCYSRIHRKSGFVGRVQIDPDSFEVLMFDRNQRAMPVDKLSAGEKQIYAISVLWALARMSGKALPMIIDTPLGRLDEEHRENLVSNFFPEASHQVVILSTDTEIDEKYFLDMQKHISHSYNIDFNIQQGFSNVNDGYLFPSEIGGVQ